MHCAYMSVYNAVKGNCGIKADRLQGFKISVYGYSGTITLQHICIHFSLQSSCKFYCYAAFYQPKKKRLQFSINRSACFLQFLSVLVYFFKFPESFSYCGPILSICHAARTHVLTTQSNMELQKMLLCTPGPQPKTASSKVIINSCCGDGGDPEDKQEVKGNSHPM